METSQAARGRAPADAPLETDYLVVGAGAMGMAFVDSLLSEQPEAQVLMVDRQHRPGGHWNHAYPWVRLHQPSAWYGVASRELGSVDKDTLGLNAGLYRMATGTEVLTHFEQVMQQRFLPSGRVRWLPMTDYQRGADGTHRVVSHVGSQARTVRVRRRLVDATQLRPEVPSTHPPRYARSPGVSCIPVNELVSTPRAYARYTVVGSGKTGIDACLWLLEHGVAPAQIRWIMPRDAWMLDRANYQPGLENFERNMTHLADQFGAIAEAGTPAAVFARLEATGALLRLDPTVEPTMYRCCTVTQDELTALRTITDVVRLGRLRAIEPTRLELDRGSLPAVADTLYIDCSAAGIKPMPRLPVFDGERINLLLVRVCQPLFSAALIAYVESHVDGDAARNAMCAAVPIPEVPRDWIVMWALTLANTAQWAQHEGLSAWLRNCRLNSNAVMARGVTPDDQPRLALLAQVSALAQQAGARVPALLAMPS
ncbi:MAG: NAD(P)/FAD-dependent oxidoreductase [Proteobacteria bacterium]|nr:NAD(P)/FAD-dependent oxidoreductase [Pseudomonadota bacterium]